MILLLITIVLLGYILYNRCQQKREGFWKATANWQLFPFMFLTLAGFFVIFVILSALYDSMEMADMSVKLN